MIARKGFAFLRMSIVTYSSFITNNYNVYDSEQPIQGDRNPISVIASYLLTYLLEKNNETKKNRLAFARVMTQ